MTAINTRRLPLHGGPFDGKAVDICEGSQWFYTPVIREVDGLVHASFKLVHCYQVEEDRLIYRGYLRRND